MIFGILAILFLPHVALGFVLGRTGSVRGAIIEIGLLFGLGMLLSFGVIPGIGKSVTPESQIGFYGLIGALVPIAGAGYAAGVSLRRLFKLPTEGLLSKATFNTGPGL